MNRMLLRLPSSIRDAVVAHARSCLPDECCGLLAGRSETGLVDAHLPLTNERPSATEFFAAPRDLLRAFQRLRRDNLDLLAVYHSHPSSPATPSRRDIADWFYPDAMMVILSLMDGGETLNGWWVCESGASAAEILLL